MRINHNMMAMNTARQLNVVGRDHAKSMEKLSSGYRINRAGDDAAGLAISEKMRAQVRGLNQASRNAQDGISLIQTAEGALTETHAILQRMREISNQSANGTNTDLDRGSLQDEMNQLTSEINRIGNSTEFNTQKILNGGMDSGDGSKATQATSAAMTMGAEFANGTVDADKGAVVTLKNAMTSGDTVTKAASTTGDMALVDNKSDTFDAGAFKITVDGVEYSNKASMTLTTTAAGATAADATAIAGQLGNLEDSEGNKLSTVADVTASTTNVKITTKSQNKESAITIAPTITAFTKANGTGAAGSAIKVGDKTFDLGSITLDATDDTTKEASLELLRAVESADGTKLGDVANVELDADGKVQFSALAEDGAIEVIGADDANLGLVAADDAGKTEASVASRVTVDNITFNLGGVKIDTANMDASIEALNNITSGGTKLEELIDIKEEGGKLTFTAKSSGETSTIEFSGESTVLGLTEDEVGADNAAIGDPTTIERAGLEASKALSTTADVVIAEGSSMKIAVGSESDVTVNLKAKTYDTSNADKNVANAAMDDLVKDLNAALQDAGLSGKVTASISKDDKIQFISEKGVDIEVKDGTGTALATSLGYTDKATDMGKAKNVEQIVGPGAQGSGFSTSFQIGSNNGQSMGLVINDMRSAALGITGNAGEAGFTKGNTVTDGTTDIKAEAALDLTSKESAADALDVLDQAMNAVSTERGKLGSVQNRLEHTIKNLDTSAENLQAAESRIRDVDMAKEMMTFTKNNILQQASQAMLAQANQAPQGVLQLLR